MPWHTAAMRCASTEAGAKARADNELVTTRESIETSACEFGVAGSQAPPGHLMTTEPLPEIKVATLDSFAGTSLPSEARQVNTALISAKAIPKLADDPRFQQVWHRFVAWSADVSLPEAERLLAIAEVIRTAQVVKRLQVQLRAVLTPAFASELPSPNLLQDADDRLNLARSFSFADAAWLNAYLARAIVQEEHGEKARVEFAGALIRRSASLSTLVATLAGAMEAVSPATETPGDTFGRRITRILAALRTTLVESELEVGEDLGQAIRALVEEPLKRVGMPREDKVAVELTREVVLFLHDVVRSRFSVASDTTLFGVLKFCRRLQGGSSWPNELRKPLDLLVKDVSEMLVLLGRQGVRDQALLDQLEVLCTSPERARGVGRELAAKHAELSEDVRTWLELGRVGAVRTANNVAVEALAHEADGAIGLALDEARRARESIESIRSDVLDALQVYEPALKAALDDALNRAIAAAVRLEHAARKRNIDLLGRAGEVLDFSPKFFEFAGARPGFRATVRRPAVVRLRPDGTPGEVIVKGVCE